eukprot:scaffold21923_cov112-Isochrysis_galbana.AAC.4
MRWPTPASAVARDASLPGRHNSIWSMARCPSPGAAASSSSSSSSAAGGSAEATRCDQARDSWWPRGARWSVNNVRGACSSPTEARFGLGAVRASSSIEGSSHRHTAGTARAGASVACKPLGSAEPSGSAAGAKARRPHLPRCAPADATCCAVGARCTCGSFCSGSAGAAEERPRSDRPQALSAAARRAPAEGLAGGVRMRRLRAAPVAGFVSAATGADVSTAEVPSGCVIEPPLVPAPSPSAAAAAVISSSGT